MGDYLDAKRDPKAPYLQIVRNAWVKDLTLNNPNMRLPDFRKPLEWGTQPQYGYERYWDTTVARKHKYWKKFDLPTPSKSLDQLRSDLYKWGFCIVEDALSRRRLLHAAGANRGGTDRRYVCTMSCIKPWKRSQENWVLS